ASSWIIALGAIVGMLPRLPVCVQNLSSRAFACNALTLECIPNENCDGTSRPLSSGVSIAVSLLAFQQSRPGCEERGLTPSYYVGRSELRRVGRLNGHRFGRAYTAERA